MEDFKVQSMLLTGGDRGIGLGLALKEMSHRKSKGCTLVVLQLDVTDPESIKAAAQKVEEKVGGSGLNLLINNAAIACNTTLETEDAQNMAAVYATNTIGPLLMCQAALNMLTRCLALRYGLCGILSVSLHPGGVKTDLGVEQEELSLASSAKGMVEVLSRLSARDNGTFLDWKGQAVPW
ncbi:hypothetical protein JD844_000009 [Phrynosoma platyrhinos]|uniref:C-factor n=1 Tax=Phrynosoma platyrhinos TaxID=52577 RepID=A0ABQ7SQ21_PHRPL|nr:hypothetical protein JD844_000009 [Phrynosoma platyrhinos]